MVETEPRESTGKHDARWLVLIGLYILAAVGGVFDVMSSNAMIAVLSAMLFAVLAVSWCAIDARRRGKPLLEVVQLIMFFTWPLSVPIYLITTRRWRGLLYTVLHAAGLSLAAIIPAWIAWHIIYNHNVPLR